MMFCQELCLKLHTEPLANQSQNRDFLVIGQKAVGSERRAHTCEGDIRRDLVHNRDLSR
jgi:hypothetical protein